MKRCGSSGSALSSQSDTGARCAAGAPGRHGGRSLHGAHPTWHRSWEARWRLGSALAHRYHTALPRAALVMLVLSRVPAFAGGSPVLSSVLPRGGQRGTQVVAEFSGARLDKAVGVVFHEPGLSLARLEQVDDRRVKCALQIAPDAPIGLHRLQIHTAQGISNVKLFSVGALSEIRETEPNSDRAKPQAIQPPVTINGEIPAEDVDWFSLTARKGETLAFEVEAMRLGDTLFDARMAIYDAAGNELAVADDTPLVRQDCAAVVAFPADGVYVVEVRETAYGGNGDCHYRLHVGAFPRPLACRPAGGKAGSEVEVTWLADPTAGRQKVTLPASLPADFAILPERGGMVAPSPVPFQVSALASSVEVEPNADHEHATPITVPGGVSGVIEGERDVDMFMLEGKKGQAFEANVYARRLRSPLDSVLEVCRFKGGAIGGNDDGAGPDSVVRFTLPEDGRYVLQLRDQLYRSGPAFSYYLEVSPVAPKLTLSIPRGLTAAQAKAAVPAGNRAGLLVTANRADFGGPLALAAAGLPAGTALHADTMHEAVNQIPLVFEAAGDAKPAGAMVDLTARHTDAAKGIEGRLLHTIDVTEVQANVPVYSIAVDRLALAVTEPAPFKVEIVEPKVPIVRRGMMELPVKLERSGEFKAPVEVRMLWNPPGIGSGAITIAGDQSAGALHLDAGEGARVGRWKIAVTATAEVGGGALEVASPLVVLEIAEPFLEFALAPVRTELGRPVDLAVKITHKAPFAGEAAAELVGLPPKVATTQTAVTDRSEEVRYTLQVPASAPAGRHGGVFVRAVVMKDGQPIVHQSPPGQIVLDKPIPPADPKIEAERIAAKKKAQEERDRRKAERIAAAARRKAERDAARKRPGPATMPATQASAGPR